MYKHGVRGLWGALEKYNAVGNAVGGIVDITGDFNTYSGRDLGIAVGIDSAKAMISVLAGVYVPIPGVILAPPLDYSAYWIKQNKLRTDKEKQAIKEQKQ